MPANIFPHSLQNQNGTSAPKPYRPLSRSGLSVDTIPFIAIPASGFACAGMHADEQKRSPCRNFSHMHIY